ncbi:MAG TPA: 3'-5' exonuclease, partial [bacterium]|nr:3'-5' exonuclease [bacterium]
TLHVTRFFCYILIMRKALRSVHEVPLLFLDVETTGLSPRQGARICEIALLRVKGGREESFFHSLVDPGIPIPEFLCSIHGITDEMVKGKPSFCDIIPQILPLFREVFIVGHNIRFDLAFLSSEMEEHFSDIKRLPVIDTLSLSRKYLRQRSNALSSLVRSLSLPEERSHSAGGDVRSTKNLFYHLLNKLRGEYSLTELHGLRLDSNCV